jgi:hypothetical protein
MLAALPVAVFTRTWWFSASRARGLAPCAANDLGLGNEVVAELAPGREHLSRTP